MNVIEHIMSHDSAKWINQKIEELPDCAKFRASNSIRALNWASRIYEIHLPIPANFCALHASEEAVAAFISCAKECGYGEDAKIDIRNHREKAVVSLLVEKIINFIQVYSPAIGYKEDTDSIAVRLKIDGEYKYRDAAIDILHFNNEKQETVEDFYDALKQSFGEIGNLKKAVLNGQQARNRIFYSDDKGYPSGFNDPIQSLERESQIALGLIWATIDMNRQKGTQVPLIAQALRTANLVINELKKKKN